MRLIRRLLEVTAVVTATTVMLPTAAHAAVVVEAESGSFNTPNCGDDGPMAVVNHSSASGGKVVFHPGNGCSQGFWWGSFSLHSIRYYMTGMAGTMCGHFAAFGGSSMVDYTNPVCAAGNTWVTGTFQVQMTGTTAYELIWVTDGSTPAWVNAYVDYHVRN